MSLIMITLMIISDKTAVAAVEAAKPGHRNHAVRVLVAGQGPLGGEGLVANVATEAAATANPSATAIIVVFAFVVVVVFGGH